MSPFFALCAAAMLSAGDASSQLIEQRSVPVASGDQFLLHPTARMGMGGLRVAVDDPWADPFVNPAKGGRSTVSSFFASPTVYGITADGGGGRTLDFAGVFTRGRWFGGGAVALQQIENEPVQGFFIVDPVVRPGEVQRLDEHGASNVYLHGLIGRRIGGPGLAIGASAAWAKLGAVDGVDLLYQGSEGVDQRGERLDLRVGLDRTWEDGRSLEVLLLYHRIQMTHEVRFIDWLWDMQGRFIQDVTRVQEEHDDTRTWGLHTGWEGPVSDGGWQVGGILTLNRKSHPRIPNYEIQNIPRDPGDTWAFDAGVGLSRTRGPFEFGVDLVIEPMWSETWSVADSTIPLPDGESIRRGDKVVDNDFFFSNVHVTVGMARTAERWDVQAGIRASAYDYTLEQLDHLAGSRREQDEAWMEWSPTWGAALKLPELEIRYSGRLTTGTGRPGVAFDGPRAEFFADANFLVAPSGPLTLQDADVLTHQIVVRLPIQ